MKTRFSGEMRVRLKFFYLPKILHASLYMDIAQLVGVIPGSDEVRGKWITLAFIMLASLVMTPGRPAVASDVQNGSCLT